LYHGRHFGPSVYLRYDKGEAIIGNDVEQSGAPRARPRFATLDLFNSAISFKPMLLSSSQLHLLEALKEVTSTSQCALDHELRVAHCRIKCVNARVLGRTKEQGPSTDLDLKMWIAPLVLIALGLGVFHLKFSSRFLVATFVIIWLKI
jgi:hypothetical protein